MSDNLIRRWNHQRLDWMRAQKLRVMKLLFDSSSRQRTKAVASENVQEILVLRLDDKLGDSVTATGFLRELKAAFPKARLSVVAGPLTGQIYQRQPAVDQVWISKKGFGRTLKLFFQLRKTSYDILINTSHIMNPRTIFLMSRLTAARKVGFRSDEYALFTDHVQYDPFRDHVTTRYQNVLTTLGITKKSLAYELHLPEVARTEAEKLLKPYLQAPVVILNSYAGARLRSLNEKNSREIALGILNKNPDAVVISIGNHNDLPVIEKWVQAAASPRWLAFFGAIDFFLNCALIERASVVVSPDTAIVHVAAAFNKPQVAIFRPDDAATEQNALIWAPVLGANAHAIVLSSERKESLPEGQEPDINDLNVGLVVDSVVDLIEKLLRS